MTIFGLGSFNKHRGKKKGKKKKAAIPQPQVASSPYPAQSQAPLQQQRPIYPNATQQLQRYPLQNYAPNLQHQSPAINKNWGNPQQGWNQSPYQYRQGGSQAYLPGQLLPPNRAPWTKHGGSKSFTDITTAVTCPVQMISDGIGDWQHKTTDYMNQGAALCDQISSKLNEIITSIDGEVFSGDEKDLVVYQQPQLTALRGGGKNIVQSPPRGVNTTVTHAITNTNYFAKANLYANSRLPPNLPPLRCYMPTYPLLCLAAQYSAQVYSKPSAKSESSTHISADWRVGTKAMVIKSVPIDASSTIIFAIRGSQTFMDWAVNLNSTPAAPRDFLDDPGNFCHSGFLSVARKMLKPVAARLRALLEEDPSRSACSLVITGHSAGGAVAALLYSHMLSNLSSELTTLTGCFKRVHCITFGAPPVSLLPLQKPSSRRHRKSLFLAFINEGDPVTRADKAYVRSLLDLYSSPAPLTQPSYPAQQPGKHNYSTTALVPFLPSKQSRPQPFHTSSAPPLPAPIAIWRVPPSTLSNAGRIVLLRGNNQSPRGDESWVRAHLTSDEQLRGVMFGDPVMHMMKVYERRIERLAVDAVKGKAY